MDKRGAAPANGPASESELSKAARERLAALRAEYDPKDEDRDTGELWLSETWWLSDIATAEGDPEEVRGVIRALGRTIAKLEAWLAARDGPGGEGDTPPGPGDKTG